MIKPRALDLFCCAGGATRGLQLAGFHVTGVDIQPQPRYCGDVFIQADALAMDPREIATTYEFIWASPPCQQYTLAGHLERSKGKEYPDLICATRALLVATGLPYAIENVPGAPLRPCVVLCGSQFCLPIARHRLIETNFLAFNLLPPCSHADDLITVCGHGTPQWMRKRRIKRGLHPNASVSVKRAAMGIGWMNREELSQAIPPAYSEWIGRKVMGSAV